MLDIRIRIPTSVQDIKLHRRKQRDADLARREATEIREGVGLEGPGRTPGIQRGHLVEVERVNYVVRSGAVVRELVELVEFQPDHVL